MVEANASPADAQREALTALAQAVVASNPEEQTFAGLSLLKRLVDNIVKNPQEDKYKKFKKTNAKIAGTVLSLQGINEYIVAMGFVSSEDQYTFGGDMGLLRKGNKNLEEALEPM